MGEEYRSFSWTILKVKYSSKLREQSSPGEPSIALVICCCLRAHNESMWGNGGMAPMILKSILDGGWPLPSYSLTDDLNFSEKREITYPCRISQHNASVYSIRMYPTYGTNKTYNSLSCFTKFVPHTGYQDKIYSPFSNRDKCFVYLRKAEL